MTCQTKMILSYIIVLYKNIKHLDRKLIDHTILYQSPMSISSTLVLWTAITFLSLLLLSILFPLWLLRQLRRIDRRNQLHSQSFNDYTNLLLKSDKKDQTGSFFIAEYEDITMTSHIRIRTPSTIESWEATSQAISNHSLEETLTDTSQYITYPPSAHTLPNISDNSPLRYISSNNQSITHSLDRIIEEV